MIDALRRSFARIVNVRTQRAWSAVAISQALFTVFFWLMVASGFGRLQPAEAESGQGFPTAVAALYFFVTLVGAPVAAHTIGALVEQHTATWKRDTAVLAFGGLGVILAVGPVVALASSEPSRAALLPALWLFGLPIILTCGVTRLIIDRVHRSVVWSRVALAVALLPPVVVALFLLGLYVAQGSGDAS